MRFSSTTADCVCEMVSPSAKFLSSPPGSSPTYYKVLTPHLAHCGKHERVANPARLDLIGDKPLA